MADDVVTDDVRTVSAEGETEPATHHDVAEGGILGAVGGAVVGALAGGPLGAVIGAVVGGVAAAGAVEVVDKHDHDHAKTVNSADVSEHETIVGNPAVPPAEAAQPAATVNTTRVVTSSSVMPGPVAADVTPQIRERAYALYELRGHRDGWDVQDWLDAEHEIVVG